jgi:sugar phosphate isomerase/epimerase
MVKFGIGTWGVRHYPYPESTYVLDWAGARGLDVEILDAWADFYSFGERECATMRDDYARRNLAVPAVCATHVTLTEPELARRNADRVTKAVELAEFMDCKIINVSLVQTVPPRSSLDPDATDHYYEVMAGELRKLADRAAHSGVALSLELHQGTLVDMSTALVRVLQMVDRPNVGANPDLGNALWAFPEPREKPSDILRNLKPHTNYWHVKNFTRVSFGVQGQAAYNEVPLPYGDIDHRLAVRQMLAEPQYDGHICVEAVYEGDPFPLLDSGIGYLRELVGEALG